MKSRFTASLAAIALLVSLTEAAAQSVIRRPGDHPNYAFEAEPHFALQPYGHDGFGPGFRGTFEIVDNGFVSSINNTVGFGFGIDWLFHGDDCNGRGNCDEDHDEVVIPLVLQWNFWLHEQWSVFGEPGVALWFHSHRDNSDVSVDPFLFFAGGRFHFNDSVALTLRLGAPVLHDSPISFGVSFLL